MRRNPALLGVGRPDAEADADTPAQAVTRHCNRPDAGGLDIAGCEVTLREGTVKIVTGKPVDAATPDNPDSNEWDGVLQ